MATERKYRGSIRFKCKSIGGHEIIVYVTEDLSDEDLQYHFERAMEREDYEYLAALSAEAQSRNFELKMANK